MMPTENPALLDPLLEFSARPISLRLDAHLQEIMRVCLESGLAELPFPGEGKTLDRWRTLARIGGTDLALAKLYEGHTDAQAIIHELNAEAVNSPGIWGVWAAEPPDARVRILSRDGNTVLLSGKKAWCSGALQIDHALMTAWDDNDQAQLVALPLDQHALQISRDDWQAVGMASTASVSVHLDQALGYCVGSRGAYLKRPGFWQGGAGIAACWYGAAQSLAESLRARCAKPHSDVHADAHLGAVDAALKGAAASLRECAAWIDRHPEADAELRVRQVRATVEAAVEHVLSHVGRALGATPFCRDPHFARLSADLPVFIRQSHGERDLAELGRHCALRPTMDWQL